MDKIAIKIENLTKTYSIFENKSDRLREALSLVRRKYHKDFYALKNINLEVKKGETLGIIGQNGSGKSTLLKILSGVLTQTSGNIQVNGRISALLELGAGFSPELTGLENIYLNGTIMGYTREEMHEKIDSIIAFADIGEFISQPVKMYSSGMFARLAFAVAINVEPEILIVDEALSVGDVRFQIKCMNKMKQMMEGGTTVLLVTHDTNAIRRFCTRVMWIHQGYIKEIGSANKVADKYLDFLKLGEMQDCIQSTNDITQINESGDLKPFVTGNSIAEIIDFKVLNRNGEVVSEISYDEYLRVNVTYDVYDENIINPVLGIAVFGLDDSYLCGLNTLLDKIEIPWIYGRNNLSLEYQDGIRAIGAKYYFDVALFEETATVAIHHIKKIKEISIIPDYKAEGKYIIPHSWRREYE